MQEIPSEKKKQALEKMISEETINQSLYKYRADDEYTEKISTCTVEKTVEIPLRHFVPCGMVRVHGS